MNRNITINKSKKDQPMFADVLQVLIDDAQKPINPFNSLVKAASDI